MIGSCSSSKNYEFPLPYESPLLDLWNESTSQLSESVSSSSSTLLDTSYKVANWMVTNRGGIAFITGALLLPSQFIGHDRETSLQILNDVEQAGNLVYGHVGDLDYAIFYPEDYDRSKRNKCILYHNPNGITIAGFFRFYPSTLHHLHKIYGCPIIAYDYLGTGLNKRITSYSSSSVSNMATWDTILQDGLTMTEEAFKLFDEVHAFGSSLGGGIATDSLYKYLSFNPEKVSKARLTNHDSFTTTSEVVLPGWKVTSRFLGNFLGGMIDSERAMSELIIRNVAITILCHTPDPVIQGPAQMAHYVESLDSHFTNVCIIRSPEWGHANLSLDMIDALQRRERI